MFKKRKDIFISLLITLMSAFSLTSTEAASPIMNSKQYLYKAGNTIANVGKPITGYYSSGSSTKPCTDAVYGKSDKCVPKYAFYALANPYSKDPIFISTSTENNWYQEKNIASLSFWGSAGNNYPDCLITNGKTTNDPTLAPNLSTAWSKTRIQYISGKSFRWSPKTPNEPMCPTTKTSGASYAIYTKGSSTPGIGLFTMAGKASHNEFWRPHLSDGSDGSANISGTFFNFLQQPDYANAIKPFSGNSSNYNVRRMLFESKQSVYNASTFGDKTTVAQVHQKTEVVFGSPTCLNERRSKPTLMCQTNYIQSSYINRREYKDGKIVPTESLPWNQYAHYNFDPNQGGLPYLGGLLKGNGAATQINYHGKLYSLWTSRGASTQFQSDLFPHTDPTTGLAVASFENLTFRTEMTFNQYLTFIRILGADFLSKDISKTVYPEDVSDSYMASKFGSKWNDPNEWIIMRIGFSQESYNSNQETESVYMGGNIKMINIQALP
jgi:hypothetical protein